MPHLFFLFFFLFLFKSHGQICLDNDIFDVNATMNNDQVEMASPITATQINSLSLTNCIGDDAADIALDDDWYAWVAEFTGIAEISIEFVTSGFPDVGVQNLDLFIYNGTTADNLLISSERISHFSNVEGVLFPVVNGQNYRIQVAPQHALFEMGSYTMNIRQSLECPIGGDMDIAEPNNDLQNAFALPGDFVNDLTLCSLSDEDYYSFTVNLPGAAFRWVGVKLEALYGGTAADLTLELFDDNGTLLQSSDFDAWCSPNCEAQIAAASGWVFLDREVMNGEVFFVRVAPAPGSSIPLPGIDSTRGITYSLNVRYSGACGFGQDRISEYVASIIPGPNAGGIAALPRFQTLSGSDRGLHRDGLHICQGERSDTVFINLDPAIHSGFWGFLRFTGGMDSEIDYDIYTFFSADPVNNPLENGDHVVDWSSITITNEERIVAFEGPTCPICVGGVLPAGWYMINFQTYDESEDILRTGTGPSYPGEPGDFYEMTAVLCQDDGFGVHTNPENPATLPSLSMTYPAIAPPCGPIPGIDGTDTVFWVMENLLGIESIQLDWTIEGADLGSNVTIDMIKSDGQEVLLNETGSGFFEVQQGESLRISLRITTLDFYLGNGNISLIVTINEIQVSPPQNSQADNTGVIVGAVVGTVVPVCFLVLLVMVIIGFCIVTRRPKFQLSDVWDDLHHETHLNDVELLELIGSGTYGNVHLADWKGTNVAAKNVANDDFTAIENEVNILKDLKHPHVLTYLGICLIDRSFYIITDYCKNGNLLNWLQTEVEEINIILLLDLLRQCASGMEYLHSLDPPVVHRDLAARNILLTGDPLHPTCKVADFGLSRTIGNLEENTQLPIRWTAPEVLDHQRKSDKDSDVWSFGVLAWEVFSFGALPYPKLSKNRDVIRFTVSGGRLEKPRFISSDIWELFEACFTQPEERPTMQGLRKAVAISCNLPRSSRKVVVTKEERGSSATFTHYSTANSDNISVSQTSYNDEQVRLLINENQKLKHKLFKAEQALNYEISSSDDEEESEANSTLLSPSEKGEHIYAYTSKDLPPEKVNRPSKDNDTRRNDQKSDRQSRKKSEKKKIRFQLDQVQERAKEHTLQKAKAVLRQSANRDSLMDEKDEMVALPHIEPKRMTKTASSSSTSSDQN